MLNERSDNATPTDHPTKGSTAIRTGPEEAPAASPDPDETWAPAVDGQAESTSAHETIVQPPTSLPNDTGETAETTHVPAAQDSDATWDPGQSDTLDHGESSDEESGETRSPTSAHRDNSPGQDPDATYQPTGSNSVEDIWGDDFDDFTPGHTLKGPSHAKPSLQFPHAPAPSTGPPNLEAQGYDLLEVLGEGGVGVVYQAIQKSVQRKVAVKMIKPGVGRDAEEEEKFISEALVTGKLDHPNIVPIHDLDKAADGRPFYTMRMVTGTPWNDVIRNESLIDNLRIFLDVCDAVSFAHSRDVIHRDLKPDNVMLGEFGEVQVMDWGLGAPVSSEGELTDLSRTQAAGGTPSYMAPEMVTGDDGPVGIHSDVYLLGAILYQIITGMPPHAGKRVLDTLENARNNVIQFAESTSALHDIAMKAMQTKPTDRYGSVNDLKRALRDYQTHAESINLCERSSDELRRAGENGDYELFAQALFGFREALVLWEDNTDALAGVADAQLQYARCAFEKGDLDLAASTLDESCAAHHSLAAEIKSAQHRRDTAKRRLKVFRVTVISLTATVIVILTIAAIWINSAKKQAVTAKEEAITAQEAEAEQRKLAEASMTKALEEETRARQALEEKEKAYADLVEAQEREKRAWAEARVKELEAEEARDELAKSGMLLDNSWWVFDAAGAKQAQQEAATAISMPVELTATLSDDVALEMVLIPPGDFIMGSPPDEEDRSADEHLHRVNHSAAFYLGKFELTEVQWQAVAGQPPPSAVDRAPDPAMPAAGVSLEQIEQDLLSAIQKYAPQGYAFRLPTEAEWEYACRAGTGTAYYTGDGHEDLDAAAWFLSNSNREVQPTGGKAPNAFGLYDMHGNAGEICTDQYVPGFYLKSPIDDPICTRAGSNMVVRGGSVLNTPQHCRAAYRSYVYRKNEYPFIGLRLALVPIRSTYVPSEKSSSEDQPADP